MNNTELAELILTKLYNKCEKEGYSKYFSLNQIANELGEHDEGKVYNVAKYLDEKGLINGVFCKGDTQGTITGNGSIFVEKGGDTGIIKKYKENPESFIFNIYGNISNSNISTHSSNVTQTISHSGKIDNLIAKILNTLENDSSITDDQKSDAINDVKTIQLQLHKKKIDKSLIKSIIPTLADIASISSFIFEIGKLIS